MEGKKCFSKCSKGKYEFKQAKTCENTACDAEWEKYFYNEKLKQCFGCPLGCKTCVSRAKCLTCTAPYLM